MEVASYCQCARTVLPKLIDVALECHQQDPGCHFYYELLTELGEIELWLADVKPLLSPIRHLLRNLERVFSSSGHVAAKNGTGESSWMTDCPTLWTLGLHHDIDPSLPGQTIYAEVKENLIHFASEASTQQRRDHLLRRLRSFQAPERLQACDDNQVGVFHQNTPEWSDDLTTYYDILWDVIISHYSGRCNCESSSITHESKSHEKYLIELCYRRQAKDGTLNFDIHFSPSPARNSATNQRWRETQFNIARQVDHIGEDRIQGSSEDLSAKAVRFANDVSNSVNENAVVQSVPNLDVCCELERPDISRLVLDFNEKICVKLDRSIRTRSVVDGAAMPLRSALHAFQISPQRRLALSIVFTNSVVQFYTSKWMLGPWSRNDLFFLNDHCDIEHQYHYFSHQILLSANQAFTKESIEACGLIHKHPKILALGIILLELELGLVLEDNWAEKDLIDGQPTPQTDFVTAIDLLEDEKKWRQVERYMAVKHLIQVCIRGEDFKHCQNEYAERGLLYQKIVVPLEHIWQVTNNEPRVDFSNLEAIHPHALSKHLSNEDRAHRGALVDAACKHVPQREQVHRHESPASQCLKSFEDDLHSLLLPTNYGSRRPIRRPRVKIAILDTGYDPRSRYINDRWHANRNRNLDGSSIPFKDFTHGGGVSLSVIACDASGHGTFGLGLLLHTAPEADIFVAKVGPNIDNVESSAVKDAIEYATAEWNVDIVTMALGFESAPKAIEKAIESAFSKRKTIFIAATSNEGFRKKVFYPARWHNLVLPVFSTNNYGQRVATNPAIPHGMEPYATFGEEIASASLSIDPEYLAVKSGASVATSIMAGIVACVLEFVRLRTDLDPESNRPSDYTYQKIHSLNGMKNVLYRMAETGQKNVFVAPEQLRDLGDDDDRRLRAIYEALIDA